LLATDQRILACESTDLQFSVDRTLFRPVKPFPGTLFQIEALSDRR
jgi:hypothetical protein